MSINKVSKKKLLILILAFTAFLRLYRLDYPNTYVFDEVYHAFTAKGYINGNIEAWEYWTTPPKGVAFEWTHPPLAKEIMAFSMMILNSRDPWAYRLPGVFFGVIAVYLVYLLALQIFHNSNTALFSSFLFSIDGINFVQSRTGMNDIYMVTFILFCILFFLKKRYLLSSVFLGLALSSKWSAIYVLGFIALYTTFVLHENRLQLTDLLQKNLLKTFSVISFFIFIPLFIYLLTYLPFFMLGHTIQQFKELHQQMWWYHTGLRATHDYASPWWSWPLNLYPVWYFVDYQKNTAANIFNSGNPVLFWLGSMAFCITIFDFTKKRSRDLFIILAGFFAFWAPWALSPRIMFLYHFAPVVPFMCLMLGQQLGTNFEKKSEIKIVSILLLLCIISFIVIFPFISGIHISREYIMTFFIFNASKNPF